MGLYTRCLCLIKISFKETAYSLAQKKLAQPINPLTSKFISRIFPPIATIGKKCLINSQCHTAFYPEAAEAHSCELQKILKTVSLLTPFLSHYLKNHVQLELILE